MILVAEFCHTSNGSKIVYIQPDALRQVSSRDVPQIYAVFPTILLRMEIDIPSILSLKGSISLKMSKCVSKMIRTLWMLYPDMEIQQVQIHKLQFFACLFIEFFIKCNILLFCMTIFFFLSLNHFICNVHLFLQFLCLKFSWILKHDSLNTVFKRKIKLLFTEVMTYLWNALTAKALKQMKANKEKFDLVNSMLYCNLFVIFCHIDFSA